MSRLIVVEAAPIASQVIDLCAIEDLPYQATYRPRLIACDAPSITLFDNDGSLAPSVQGKLESLRSARAWLEPNFAQFVSSEETFARDGNAVMWREGWGTVVAGRRGNLDSLAGTRLREYNRMLGGIQIRTYDWLQDAMLAVENEPVDPSLFS